MMDNDGTELIRARAYEIWEEEGRPAGRETEHWRQAEIELREALDVNAGSPAETVARDDSPIAQAEAPTTRSRRKKAADM